MSLIQLVDGWNKQRQKDLIASYESEGLKASGRWAKSLEGETTQSGNTIKTVILGEQYTGALVGGRKPNSKQDAKSLKAFVGWAGSTFLKDWVKNKGKNLNPYAVAYSIARKGINVPNRYNSGQFINRVFDVKAIDELKKILTDSMAETTRQEIISVVKK